MEVVRARLVETLMRARACPRGAFMWAARELTWIERAPAQAGVGKRCVGRGALAR